MPLTTRIATLAAALALVLCATASAATRYVDDSGTNSPKCLNPGAPCKTIAYTLQEADSQDTVEVGGGTYAEQVVLGAGASLVGSNFSPAVTGGPAIVDGGAGTAVTSSTDGGIRKLSLRGQDGGLKVTGGAPTISQVAFDDPQAVSAGRLQITGGNPIRVAGSTFAGVGTAQFDTGIDISPGYKGSITVAASTLTHLNVAIGDGAGLTGATVLDLHDNTISVHGALGNVYGEGVISGSSKITARNNVLSGVAPGISQGFNLNDVAAKLQANRFSGFATAVNLFTPSNPVTMSGDLIVNNAVGIDTSVLTAPVTLTNETIVDNAKQIAILSGPISVDSSIIGAGGIEGSDCTITFSRGPTTTGNSCQAFQTSADPAFAGAGDYHLSAASPLIDAGNPAPPPPGEFDFDGQARLTDGDGDCTARRDMGVFEHAASASCTAPAGPAGPAGPSGRSVANETNGAAAAPRLTSLRIARRVRAARRASVSFRLDRAASVSLRVERLLGGRKLGRRCVGIARGARIARSRRCTRASAILRLRRSGHAGANTLKLPARIHGRPLLRGSYRLVAVATDAGRSSLPARRGFHV
jgi:hypothetical protein